MHVLQNGLHLQQLRYVLQRSGRVLGACWCTRLTAGWPFTNCAVLCDHVCSIDKLGRICLDVLKDKWSPALQIRTVLLRWAAAVWTCSRILTGLLIAK